MQPGMWQLPLSAKQFPGAGAPVDSLEHILPPGPCRHTLVKSDHTFLLLELYLPWFLWKSHIPLTQSFHFTLL